MRDPDSERTDGQANETAREHTQHTAWLGMGLLPVSAPVGFRSQRGGVESVREGD